MMESEWWTWLQERRDEGWCVRITMLPDNLPYRVQGSASEYAGPGDVDHDLEGTEGHVSVVLSWLHYEEDPPVEPWPRISGLAPTAQEAVDQARRKYEERDSGE